MKLFVLTITALIAATVSVVPSGAYADSAKFPLKGLFKSGYVGTGAGTPAVVIDDAAAPSTAPGSGQVFIVQQVCCTTGGTQTTIQVGPNPSFNPLILQMNTHITGCQQLSPGVVVDEGADVYIHGTSQSTDCRVSGIVAKKQ